MLAIENLEKHMNPNFHTLLRGTLTNLAVGADDSVSLGLTRALVARSVGKTHGSIYFSNRFRGLHCCDVCVVETVSLGFAEGTETAG